jgi:hemoglobin
MSERLGTLEWTRNFAAPRSAAPLSPTPADRFIERARRVAESLELGVASASGVLLGKGERYWREA